MGGVLRRRMALTLVAILILTPFVFLRAINSPVIQAKILRFVSSLSPWDIHVESLKLSLWGPKVSIAGRILLKIALTIGFMRITCLLV